MDELQSNEFYYNSRGHFSFFEPLYKDYEAMNTFRQVLSFNPLQIRDKVVLDVGSGPGLFALLAARAGAKTVYAWEPSAQAKYLAENIRENGYEDTIQVLTKPIEELEIEPVDIVFTSQFGLGFYLNSLVDQFQYAIKHYLKDGGVVLPSKYRFSMSTYSPSQMFRNQPFWDDVYGFDYSVIGRDHLRQAFTSSIAESRINTTDSTVGEGDFREPMIDDWCSFTLDVVKSGDVCGFLFWWDTVFDIPNRETTLSTSPRSNDTHWSQVCVPFGKMRNLQAGDKIMGDVKVKPCNNNLGVSFDIKYRINDEPPSEIHSIFK